MDDGIRVFKVINNALQELEILETSASIMANESLVFFTIIAGVATVIFDYAGFFESASGLEVAVDALVQSARDAILLLEEVTNPIRQSHELLIVTPHMYDVITNIREANNIIETNLPAYEAYLQVPDNYSTAGPPDNFNIQISRLINFRDELETMLRIPRVLDQIYLNYTTTFVDENIVDFLEETRGLLAEFNRFSDLIDRLIELRNNATRPV